MSDDQDRKAFVVCDGNDAKRRRVSPDPVPPSANDDCVVRCDGLLEGAFFCWRTEAEKRERADFKYIADALTDAIVTEKTRQPELQTWLKHTQLASVRKASNSVGRYEEILFNVGVSPSKPAFTVAAMFAQSDDSKGERYVVYVITPYLCVPVKLLLQRHTDSSHFRRRVNSKFDGAYESKFGTARKFWHTEPALLDFLGLERSDWHTLAGFVNAVQNVAEAVRRRFATRYAPFTLVRYEMVTHRHDAQPPRPQRPLKTLCAEDHVLPCPIARDAFLAGHVDIYQALEWQLCARARVTAQRVIDAETAGGVQTLQLDREKHVLRFSLLRSAGSTRQLIEFELDFDDVKQLAGFM